MKKIVVLALALILAVVLAIFLPEKESKSYEGDSENTSSILSQKVLSYSEETIDVYKIYNEDNLIATISDLDYIKERINQEYQKYYEDEYPNMSLSFDENITIVQEKVHYHCEDIDDEIVDYLIYSDNLGLQTTAVEFYTDSGVYEVIYVLSDQEFENALNKFLLNFVEEDSLKKIMNNEEISDLSDYGSLDVDFNIQENISLTTAIAKPQEIFNEDEIYEFLCYGRNEERQYYTVSEGDTLAGVGFRFNDMSATQIMMLNSDVIKSTDQVLVPGTELNVTYYTSPLTVVVTKQRLASELMYPGLPQYIEDVNLFTNESEVEVAEENGYKNVLHEETWINGVQQEGDNIISSVTVKEPVQAVIRVGNKPLPNVGTGNFIWAIDNVSITCGWGCYYGHQAIDLQNMYDRYGNVYAADNGTVETVSYDGISGNYVVINHNNGYTTYYGHFNTVPYVEEGETVYRGQVIGQIGMTGWATGPHVHFEIRIDGTRVDPCTVMNCELVPWR